tara:strand:- start:113 stop:457 length:345 start_codon:yes stop_codon:yes gene_type:complete
MVEYPVQDFEVREEEEGYNLGYFVGQKIRQYEVLSIIKRDLVNYSYSSSITITLADVVAEMGVDIEDYEESMNDPDIPLTKFKYINKVLVDIINRELRTIRRELREVGVTYPSE